MRKISLIIFELKKYQEAVNFDPPTPDFQRVNHSYLGKTGLGAVGGSPVGVGENGRDV